MGIFAYFKKMFNKNIENDEMYDGEFVHLYSRNPATFEVGYNIVVRPGFNAVFVARDRVTDVLPPGKYRIGLESLPLTFHRLKMDRVRKNSKPRNKFKADLYFVNINAFKGLTFDSDYPYINKTKELGKVIAYAEGTYDAQVTDPGDFVCYLLLDRAYVTNNVAIKILGLNVGNNVNKTLEKSKMKVTDIFKSPSSAEQLLNEKLAGAFMSIGVNVSDIKLKYFNISSKSKQKIDESITQEQTFVEEYKEFSQNDTPTMDVDPSTFVVENNTEQLTTKAEPSEYTVEQSVETSAPSSASVAGTNQALGKKTCPNCNALIDATAKFCQNCGFNVDAL